MATITKEFLSGGTANGRPIKVVATGTPGTTLHTAHGSAKDEVSVWLSNTSSTDQEVTVELGGVAAPDDHIKITVPAKDSVLAVPGIPLSGGLLVRAFAAAANVITAWGYVNRIQ
jgi:hypothetical protein